MSATHRKYSNKPKCLGSQQNFFSYASDSKQGDDGRVQCPECGKPVMLIGQFGRDRNVRKKHFIPNHNTL